MRYTLRQKSADAICQWLDHIPSVCIHAYTHIHTHTQIKSYLSVLAKRLYSCMHAYVSVSVFVWWWCSSSYSHSTHSHTAISVVCACLIKPIEFDILPKITSTSSPPPLPSNKPFLSFINKCLLNRSDHQHLEKQWKYGHTKKHQLESLEPFGSDLLRFLFMKTNRNSW